MRMRLSLALAVALLAAAIFVWAMRGRDQHRPASARSDAPPSVGPKTQPACLPAPSPKSVAKPSSLDGKVVFHLVTLDGSRTGCRVEFRDPENGLAKSGLKEGDVILEVAGQPMSTRVALGLVQRLEQASLTGLDLTISRDGKTEHVDARIGH